MLNLQPGMSHAWPAHGLLEGHSEVYGKGVVR